MSKKIYAALLAAKKAVDPYLIKDTQVQNKYKAVSHDYVSAKCRDILTNEGIIVIPSVVESKTHFTVRNGKEYNLSETTYAFEFICAEDGSSVTASSVGQGEDQGDKGPGKAFSYAFKNVLLKVFMIETGVNDESRVESERFITDSQREAMQKKIADSGLDTDSQDAITQAMCAAAGVENISYIPAKQYNKYSSKLIASIDAAKKGVNNAN